MNITKTTIPEVIIIEPKIFGDERGYFFESFNEKVFCEKVIKTDFIQDNEAKSSYGVLRGLHYQLPPFAQSKLVRVIEGKVLDVAVDIRQESPTFGKYVSVELSGENKRQLFVPRGFAHGYVVLSNEAIFAYKVDNIYSPESEGSIIFNDTSLNIDWKIKHEDVILSEKDKISKNINEVELFNYKDKLY
ncbi:MAG: dTDP-4-dehydrorhamnose 3,5-epimerase [Bacteroidales bacterium]|nr:dTDP-4-dehydrorhamnose 3,5-epimerase [Bacteroidales bacterium]